MVCTLASVYGRCLVSASRLSSLCCKKYSPCITATALYNCTLLILGGCVRGWGQGGSSKAFHGTRLFFQSKTGTVLFLARLLGSCFGEAFSNHAICKTHAKVCILLQLRSAWQLMKPVKETNTSVVIYLFLHLAGMFWIVWSGCSCLRRVLSV